MRWVNDTLPPRLRRRWLLMTVRLSARSLAGTARTLVAVGTVRLVSMLATTRAAAPFSGVFAEPAAGATAGVGAAGVAAAGGAAAAGAGGGGAAAAAGAAAGAATGSAAGALSVAALPLGVPFGTPLAAVPS